MLTRPDRRAWREVFALAILFVIAAGIAARLTPVLSQAGEGGGEASLSGLALTLAVAFLIPAFTEELVFRGLLQPPNVRSVVAWLARAGSLALFVIWHPVQVWLGLPYARAVFLDPVFLTLAGLLGLFATLSVHLSGSLWPAVVLHWIAVAVWTLGTG